MPRPARGVAWIAALAALWVYIRTLAPTVTWRNTGEDSGDLLAAAVTLGIPHPTGYPLFVLLGRVASLVPLGPTAFRINLIAALAGAASIYFLARLTLGLARAGAGWRPSLVAGVCALLYAFALGPWSQSVFAEVYSLHAAILGAALWALLRAEETRSARLFLIACYVAGLGFTNHLLSVALLPALVLGGWRLRRAGGASAGVLLLAPLAVLWGASLVLYLPIRAAQGPEFSWGAPSTPDRLVWVLTGAQYRANLLQRDLGSALGYLVPGRFWLDLGWGSVLVGLGLVASIRYRLGLALPTVTAFLASAILLAAYTISDDVGYWMPLLYAICAVGGAGLAAFAARARVPLRIGLGLSLVLAVGVALATHVRVVDASNEWLPRVWAHRSLESVERDALIVSEYDGRTFALWFYAATDFRMSRPELAVAYKYLLVWPWYRHHLARRHKSLRIPPGPNDADALMNRLIALNIRSRPVYVVREDPALLPIFALEATGHPRYPIYRVRLRNP